MSVEVVGSDIAVRVPERIAEDVLDVMINWKEGEAECRENCHPVKYTHGHSQHEWDYWSTDGSCDGWNH